MRNFSFTINGNKYDVEIGEIEDNIIDVSVNGSTYEVEVDRNIQPIKTPKLVRPKEVPSTDVSPQVQKTAPSGTPVGGGNIKSPLPGVILDIHVREGDKVSLGQKLITLEAMKMENVINSDKDGTVGRIKVHKNDNVMEGDILIEIN